MEINRGLTQNMSAANYRAIVDVIGPAVSNECAAYIFLSAFLNGKAGQLTSLGTRWVTGALVHLGARLEDQLRGR